MTVQAQMGNESFWRGNLEPVGSIGQHITNGSDPGVEHWTEETSVFDRTGHVFIVDALAKIVEPGV